jgi:diaminohydroxyphosphoribosylaminopyrimidine deaminase / 5-amino-6-(5-phosphoribosylamino)uracil reductase
MTEAPLSAEAWDERFMAAANSIGRRNLGQTFPNPAVGALVVRFENGQPVIIARGYTAQGGRPHAETEALRIAGDAARGATTYVTLEPCAHHGKTPPCANAIISAGIARAVIAVEDPNPEVRRQGNGAVAGSGHRCDAGRRRQGSARITHAGHFRRMTQGRPHLMLKIAVSADGKTGLAGRRPAEISCETSRADGAHDACQRGCDPGRQRNRHRRRSNAHVPAAGHGRTVAHSYRSRRKAAYPDSSHLVRTAREVPVWVMTTDDRIGGDRAPCWSRPGSPSCAPGGTGGSTLASLKRLGERGITRVLVEGGPILSSMLLRRRLVDEAIVVRSERTCLARMRSMRWKECRSARLPSPRGWKSSINAWRVRIASHIISGGEGCSPGSSPTSARLFR